MPYFEILVIFLLLILNGVFAMSELAIVSAKKIHLRKLADEGNVNAQRALDFAEDTGRFLPTVQIGITLIGILAGAFSGATLADYATDYFMQFGLTHERAEFISVSIIVVTITYLTLIIGELVPKELALRRPEAMALFVTPLIYRLSRLTWPFVWILNKSSIFVLKLIRAGDKPDTTVTQEEIHALIEEGTGMGVFDENERDMLSGVMLLGDKPIRAFIRPRIDVASLPEDASLDDLKELMLENRYSRFPIRSRENENQILGVVHIKDILEHLLHGKEVHLKDMVEEVMVFPDTADAMTVLDELSSSPVHLAVIIDEHGSFEGIVTLTDMLAIITGGVNENGDEGEEFFRRNDGSWLMDGGILIDRAFEEIGLNEKHENDSFHTLAGFVLNYFHAVPKVGDLFDYNGYSFEVVDIDGHRIDKILIKKREE
jgi:putative hemolysin